ncbi:hypothetical protein [Chenggangzhangella methanolivorans]|uniref:Uncharacterized protein n=1 Tax=Chenggangzhangella methanolivorans TaxID=1437009 RepID=A0A9E6R6Z7_9HYPH|nr:hypothetical protein [Chenggangzhangella methanolivorans]QZN98556.1 hypothetical protein K6K41_16090 [Chenggangzhangella methanolivorans]
MALMEGVAGVTLARIGREWVARFIHGNRPLLGWLELPFGDAAKNPLAAELDVDPIHRRSVIDMRGDPAG